MTTATLKWTNPTARTDGTSLDPSEILSVDVFDSASVDPTVPLVTLPGAATGFTTDVLTVGVHNFTVGINDTTGHKSAPSNSASLTVAATLASPNAVADLAVTPNAS